MDVEVEPMDEGENDEDYEEEPKVKLFIFQIKLLKTYSHHSIK